jgi:hypothetical protein
MVVNGKGFPMSEIIENEFHDDPVLGLIGTTFFFIISRTSHIAVNVAVVILNLALVEFAIIICYIPVKRSVHKVVKDNSKHPMNTIVFATSSRHSIGNEMALPDFKFLVPLLSFSSSRLLMISPLNPEGSSNSIFVNEREKFTVTLVESSLTTGPSARVIGKLTQIKAIAAKQ